MYICELLPLKTTRKIDTLSYFTSLNINVGDLVEINMNGQILNAIVLNYKDIRQAKTEIRASDFKIKKITKIIKEKYINGKLLQESYRLSTLLGTSLSNLFNTMLPVNILESVVFEKREGRASRGLLEESPEHIFYISPTQKEAKDIIKKYNTKNSTTPSLTFLCDEKINTIIINKKNSRHYYSTFKDINTKVCIEYFCKVLNIKVEYLEGENNKININICEINKETETRSIYFTKDNFNKVKIALKENKKIALYAQRLGNSTSVVCEDCKSIQKCKDCDKPYILKKEIKNSDDFENIETNYLFCNMCKSRKNLNNILKCDHCKSFRLLPLGIGADGLQEYIKKEFGIESEKIKVITEKDISKLKDIDLIIVISLDSLFSLNEYSIDENIFNLLLTLSNSCKSDAELIIQTRQDKKVFDKFLNASSFLDSEKFYKLEYKIREKNNLPPYSYILTYESELEMPVPKFLESFNNYKIKLKINTSKFKISVKYVNRHIYFINKKEWEENLELRERCFLNLYNYNLKVNPQSVLS